MDKTEITKAMECHRINACHKCPYEGLRNCIEYLCDDAVSLVKELGEENEGLTSSNKILVNNNADLETELAKTYDLLEDAKGDTVEEYRKRVYSKMEKYTVFGREYIQRIMREVAKEMVGDKDV